METKKLNTEKVRISLPFSKDERFKSWRKILTGIDKSKDNGYAFLGDFVSTFKNKDIELPIGTYLMVYDEVGSVKYHSPEVYVYRVDGEFQLTELFCSFSWNWALDLRDEVAKLFEDNEAKKEILDKLSSIRTYQSPLQSIRYSYKYKDNIVIKVTDNPNCFAHSLMILLDRNKNEIDKWLERYSNRREIQYETVIKTLKDNSKSEQLLPIKFIELVELDEEEKYTFAYLKTKYIAIVEIDNKKYVANPYLLKWLIKENYNIYAKKEILQDNFDTDYNSIHMNTNFFVILKKNDEIKGLVSGLIYKDEDLTNIYREKK